MLSHYRWPDVARECGLVLWGKPECPEKTNLSDLVTANQTHTPGLVPVVFIVSHSPRPAIEP